MYILLFGVSYKYTTEVQVNDLWCNAQFAAQWIEEKWFLNFKGVGLLFNKWFVTKFRTDKISYFLDLCSEVP